MHNIRLKNGDIIAVETKEDCFDVIREYLGSELVGAISGYCAEEIEAYQYISEAESEEKENYKSSLEHYRNTLLDAMDVLDELIYYIDNSGRISGEKIRSTLVDILRKSRP